MKYWNNVGKHQALYEQLNKLIPASGPCENARGKNKALDKLRRACNCYYDLYNNGLYNRAAEFHRLFGFSGKPIATANYKHYLNDKLDEQIDIFIEEAAKEQGLLAN